MRFEKLIIMNNEHPDEHDITRRILGDGGEWVFPSESTHCQYEMYKSDIEWIDGRTAVCPKCGKKVYAYIIHERDGKTPPKKEPVKED
ncbi:MAG: hypothetical protein P1Q69_02495 [Candidatus Thorarchaeota archaeon]|nr:hypothetical protein [Candidatus Thorarchaeota archaeon]